MKWYHNSVFYQIYPQSFQDSDGDGLGDLQGIIDRLDYLVDLGVDAIWLNPIYPSPFKDAGYDIVDYKNIARRYGNLRVFDRLVDAVHRRGMRVLLDLVFNHTSDRHPWFVQSQKKKRNRYSKWYVWSDGETVGRLGEAQWASWAAERYESYLHRFTFHQPDLNHGFPDLGAGHGNSYEDADVKRLREELKSVVRFWLDREVDGFRCDAADHLVIDSAGRCPHPSGLRFWSEMAEVVEGYKDRAFIAETSHHLAQIRRGGFKGAFFLWDNAKLISDLGVQELGKKVKPHFFSPAGGDISWFVEPFLREVQQARRYGGAIHLISGSHDIPRMKQVMRRDSVAECYFALLLTLPTAPFIYYGDEIGMEYRANLPAREGSSFRAGSRTPMQWDGTRNAGFSRAGREQCYFPVGADAARRNVANQLRDRSSLLNTVKKLIALRRSAKGVLGAAGKMRQLYCKKNGPIYVYSRYGGNRAWVVGLNPSDKMHSVTVVLSGREAELRGVRMLQPMLSNGRAKELDVRRGRINLQLDKNSFVIYQAQ